MSELLPSMAAKSQFSQSRFASTGIIPQRPISQLEYELFAVLLGFKSSRLSDRNEGLLKESESQASAAPIYFFVRDLM